MLIEHITHLRQFLWFMPKRKRSAKGSSVSNRIFTKMDEEIEWDTQKCGIN